MLMINNRIFIFFSFKKKNEKQKILVFLLFIIYFLKSAICHEKVVDETQLKLTAPIVTQLFAENLLDKMEENKEAFWASEFIIPWCHHCQNLIPQFGEAAVKYKKDVLLDNNLTDINFAMVDCSISENKDICQKTFDVTMYPDIKMLQGGRIVCNYTLVSRNARDIYNWARRAIMPAVHEDLSEIELKKLLFNEKSTYFVLLLNKNNNENEKQRKLSKIAYTAFKNEATKYFYLNYFIVLRKDPEEFTEEFLKEMKVPKDMFSAFYSSNSSLHFSALSSIYMTSCGLNSPEDFVNITKIYEETEPHDIDNFFAEYISYNRFPLIAEITYNNFFMYRTSGFKLVLLILNFSHEFFANQLSRFEAIARSWSGAKKYLFAYIDGVNYSEILKDYGILSVQLPRLIVFDEKPQSYYEDSEILTFENLDNALRLIMQGALHLKKEININFFYSLWLDLKSNYFLLYAFAKSSVLNFFLTVIIFLIVIFFLVFLINLIRNALFGTEKDWESWSTDSECENKEKEIDRLESSYETDNEMIEDQSKDELLHLNDGDKKRKVMEIKSLKDGAIKLKNRNKRESKKWMSYEDKKTKRVELKKHK